MCARRPLQSDQAFEAFEGKLDTPAQAIEIQDIGCGEAVPIKRRDQNDPFGGGEGRLGYLMLAFAGVMAGFGFRYFDLFRRDCQEFRVRAGIMGKKESQYDPKQRACDTE